MYNIFGFYSPNHFFSFAIFSSPLETDRAGIIVSSIALYLSRCLCANFTHKNGKFLHKILIVFFSLSIVIQKSWCKDTSNSNSVARLLKVISKRCDQISCQQLSFFSSTITNLIYLLRVQHLCFCTRVRLSNSAHFCDF